MVYADAEGEVMEKHIADLMIELYGEEALKELPLREILRIAWFFYINPIDEKAIKEIFWKNGKGNLFKEIPI